MLVRLFGFRVSVFWFGIGRGCFVHVPAVALFCHSSLVPCRLSSPRRKKRAKFGKAKELPPACCSVLIAYCLPSHQAPIPPSPQKSIIIFPLIPPSFLSPHIFFFCHKQEGFGH